MTEVVWTFETKRFRVALEIDPEDIDPADHFEEQEDIDAIRNGEVEWFQAAVVVYFKPDDGRPFQIGFDSLGACAYHTVREFYTSHRDPDPMNRNCTIMRAARGQNVVVVDYFPSMVRQAIEQARGHIEAMRLC